MLKTTLPAYINLKPAELVVCLDDPTPEGVLEAVTQTIEKHDFKDKTKILQIDRSGWSYQMAKVRRVGFDACTYDRILTGDIDCLVNKHCLKAVSMVGKDNIGQVSVSKLHVPHNLLDFYRLFGNAFIRIYAHNLAKIFGKSFGGPAFSGVYALWRPYWRDSEAQEEIKKRKSAKQDIRRGYDSFENVGSPGMGEDMHLRIYMEKKHKVVYLPDIGALVLSDLFENAPIRQHWNGTYFALQNRRLLVALGRTFLRAQPYYLLGHLYGKKLLKMRKGSYD